MSAQPDQAIKAEALQELDIPTIVSTNRDDFAFNYKTYRQSLDRVCIAIAQGNHQRATTKIIDGEDIKIVDDVHLYFGIYEGGTKPADQEAAGLRYMQLDDMLEEADRTLGSFTPDMYHYMTHHVENLRLFSERAKALAKK